MLDFQEILFKIKYRLQNLFEGIALKKIHVEKLHTKRRSIYSSLLSVKRKNYEFINFFRKNKYKIFEEKKL